MCLSHSFPCLSNWVTESFLNPRTDYHQCRVTSACLETERLQAVSCGPYLMQCDHCGKKTTFRFHPKIELPSSQLFLRTPACPIPPQLSFLIEWLAPRPFPFLTAPLFPYFSTFNSISKHTATTVRSIVQNTLSQEEDILCRTQNHPDGRGRRSVWPKMPLELNSHSYLWLGDTQPFLALTSGF